MIKFELLEDGRTVKVLDTHSTGAYLLGYLIKYPGERYSFDPRRIVMDAALMRTIADKLDELNGVA